MALQEFPWSVETALNKISMYDRERAYTQAEEIQSNGETVEIYYHGKLETRLKGRKQYSFLI